MRWGPGNGVSEVQRGAIPGRSNQAEKMTPAEPGWVPAQWPSKPASGTRHLLLRHNKWPPVPCTAVLPDYGGARTRTRPRGCEECQVGSRQEEEEDEDPERPASPSRPSTPALR